MIIRRIHIENFGHFHDYTLELAPGMNRLREANEFGKTTLFEFVRRVLWGYPDGRKSQTLNRYPARFNSGEYGGFIEVELSDGTTAVLERYGQKGKLVVRRPDGSEEEGEEFLRRLTPVSGDCYRNVYAVTLDELTMLSSLDGDEIRGRLYGGAITGNDVSLPKLGKRLDDRAKELYKQRGAASKIAAARQRLRDAADRLAEAVNACSRRGALEAELAASERETAHLRAEAATYAKSAAAEELLLKAHPHYLRVAEAEAALAEIPSGREVAESDARRAEELAKKIAETPPPPVDATRPAVLAAELALLDRELAASGGSEPLPGDADLAEAQKLAERAAETAKPFASPPWIMMSFAVALLAAAATSCASHPWWIVLLAIAALAAVAGAGGMLWYSRLEKKWRSAAAETERAVAEFRAKTKLDCPPEKFADALEARKRRRDIARELDELEKARHEHERFAASKRELDELCHRFDCADAPQMRRAAQRTIQANELRRRRAAAAAALDALIPPEKRPDFAHFDPAAARSRRDGANAKRAEVEQSVFLLHQKAGAVANELEHLPHDGEIEFLNSEIEAAKATLHRLVREYLVVRSCRALLDAAVDRYERESQPEVFRHAEKLFAGFTAGRYTRLYKKLATGELTVRDDATQQEKTFTQLSRGTREELMLAMRLALIECTERDSEPLPVCFDDVGVNFDPARLARAEAAVAEFARNRQVIWFSHS